VPIAAVTISAPFEEATPKIAGQTQGDRTARSMLLAFATMVDSRKGGVMADRIDHLTERVQVVEVTVDRLSSTVDQLSTRVDGLTTTVGQLSTRVDGLTTTVNELSTVMAAGFVEQREYKEFSHARLEAKIDAGYTRLEAKMDAGFARVDRKLDRLIDAHRPRRTPKRRNE
jgi:outer membrane murein-binding lipoprotein Lpp